MRAGKTREREFKREFKREREREFKREFKSSRESSRVQERERERESRAQWGSWRKEKEERHTQDKLFYNKPEL
jgi:hypothetical protein